MSATALVMTNPKPNTHKAKFYNGSLKWPLRIVSILVLVALLSTLATIFQVTARMGSGLGLMKSEKTLNYSGNADSNLLLGMTGVNTTESILGFAPVVSTLSTANAVAATATLRGRVTNMNGMPSATGYFQWGYSAGSLSNTTPSIPITATGDYSANIVGLTSNEVFYRFVTDADGTAYGLVTKISNPAAVGTVILKNLIRVIIAAVILITTIYLGAKNYVTMMLAAILGITAFVIINVIIEMVL